MAESVKQRSNKISAARGDENLYKVLAAMQTDIANLRASVVGLTAKLDADATVADTNYAALWNPAALNTVA